MPTKVTPFIKNFYTFQTIEELKTPVGATIGQAITTFEIYRRRDVTNLNSYLGYAVVMKQRIIIPNGGIQAPGLSTATSYTNYPAILLNQIVISTNNGGTIQLNHMFPRTLNSSVSLSSSDNSGSNQSSTQQNSSGSSTTNVNTFGVGLSGGFFGPVPMGTLSLDYSHSWEHSTSDASMNGTSAGTDRNAGFGDSMSIKDWSSYGYLDADRISPNWLWGQTYPWDVIQYNQSSDGSTINLPSFVQDRLLGQTAGTTSAPLVLPPSQLSLFGTDFTMQAIWMIDFPNGLTGDETVTLNHTTQSFTASHQLNGANIEAQLQSSSNAASASFTSGPIDLSTYALNPINGSAGSSRAAIGFTATPFSYPPTSPTAPFKIVSSANNVQVTGLGFDPTMTSNLSDPTSLEITFKIADVAVNYSLFLMHWIGAGSGACKLTWTLNGQTGSMYVESTEGNGGQNNLSTIELRNTDFTSINFHDYLIIGTNVMTITVVATDATKTNAYSLFAIAIGEG